LGQQQELGGFLGNFGIFEKRPLPFGGLMALYIWIIALFLENEADEKKRLR